MAVPARQASRIFDSAPRTPAPLYEIILDFPSNGRRPAPLPALAAGPPLALLAWWWWA